MLLYCPHSVFKYSTKTSQDLCSIFYQNSHVLCSIFYQNVPSPISYILPKLHKSYLKNPIITSTSCLQYSATTPVLSRPDCAPWLLIRKRIDPCIVIKQCNIMVHCLRTSGLKRPLLIMKISNFNTGLSESCRGGTICLIRNCKRSEQRCRNLSLAEPHDVRVTMIHAMGCSMWLAALHWIPLTLFLCDIPTMHGRTTTHLGNTFEIDSESPGYFSKS
jgi:hypothetical protein